MGVIFPIFRHFGNFPSVKLLLIIVFRGSAIQLLSSLVSLQEMLSYPDESFDGRSSIIFSISSVLIGLKENFSFGIGAFERSSSTVTFGIGIFSARSGAKFT